MSKEVRNFNRRYSNEYHLLRTIFYMSFLYIVVFGFFNIFYNYKIEGRENIPKCKKNGKFIFAANHVSIFDPTMVAMAGLRPIAFMAKKQLFEPFWSRVLMDWCGAFAVNREKLEVSTIKTALAVRNSFWKLGIFPQGTRDKSSTIKNITRGFVALAKASDCNILPVSIIKQDGVKKGIIHSGKITIKIGNLIPCGDFQETMDNWGKAVSALSGLEYIPST